MKLLNGSLQDRRVTVCDLHFVSSRATEHARVPPGHEAPTMRATNNLSWECSISLRTTPTCKCPGSCSDVNKVEFHSNYLMSTGTVFTLLHLSKVLYIVIHYCVEVTKFRLQSLGVDILAGLHLRQVLFTSFSEKIESPQLVSLCPSKRRPTDVTDFDQTRYIVNFILV